ncbi:pilus assembly FimT family protein [Aporhodopirellula aestuarii]|uniref:Prepilin-type N-terminal cleavage/methylation domain-containing protein n=1 Tax=Aporhodopirellula aestuarii TaxID=2950107 RepID=A0ABT0TZT2_9BACT|nr:GspH/FimT family pseudopilin [Aporhodopirellula aestuarii]MCM2369743.1 prepilin-type N-terminal cleavage/methylation domain-containing protein [Aporhodopirellula aestuarii]
MKRNGVTLLEVLMVIVISTGTLSIATLSWTSIHRTFLSRTGVMDDADEVLRCLRMARETAVMSQSEVSVRYVNLKHPSTKLRRTAIEMTMKPSPYRPAVDANQVGHFGAATKSGSNWMVDPIWLSEQAVMRSNASKLTFQPDGTADRDAKWQITLGDATATAVVYSLSGDIHLVVSP